MFISLGLFVRYRCQYAVFKVQSLVTFVTSGDKGIRTLDPLLARQVLSQLSYTPIPPKFLSWVVGLSGPFLPSERLCFLNPMGLSGPFLLSERLCFLKPVGLSGLEPPTSRLSGVRSNQLSYKPKAPGIHLSSHTVSSIVFSAAYGLTVVFGMGTGVSRKRIDTRNLYSVPFQEPS